jgi:hypothetical protein
MRKVTAVLASICAILGWPLACLVNVACGMKTVPGMTSVELAQSAWLSALACIFGVTSLIIAGRE